MIIIVLHLHIRMLEGIRIFSVRKREHETKVYDINNPSFVLVHGNVKAGDRVLRNNRSACSGDTTLPRVRG
jgi:chloramphenicol O-acetyltransferase